MLYETYADWDYSHICSLVCVQEYLQTGNVYLFYIACRKLWTGPLKGPVVSEHVLMWRCYYIWEPFKGSFQPQPLPYIVTSHKQDTHTHMRPPHAHVRVWHTHVQKGNRNSISIEEWIVKKKLLSVMNIKVCLCDISHWVANACTYTYSHVAKIDLRSAHWKWKLQIPSLLSSHGWHCVCICI